MNPMALTQMYDNIKKDSMAPVVPKHNMHIGPGGLDQSPGALAYRNKAADRCERLKDKCRKHILLDIYCKILPLDKDWVDCHQGQCSGDIDGMLAQKGMSATQYLTSCFEATHAPFVEFLINSTDAIGRVYMENEEEVMNDAQQKDIELPDPKEPELEDDDVEGSLVDIQKDTEYEDFVDKLKKKTVNKIVSDITSIIDNKKDENDMTFNVESAVGVSMDYINKHNWNTRFDQDAAIGMAIREATLRELDLVFNQPITFQEFATLIRTGRGAVINEKRIASINE